MRSFFILLTFYLPMLVRASSPEQVSPRASDFQTQITTYEELSALLTQVDTLPLSTLEALISNEETVWKTLLVEHAKRIQTQFQKIKTTSEVRSLFFALETVDMAMSKMLFSEIAQTAAEDIAGSVEGPRAGNFAKYACMYSPWGRAASEIAVAALELTLTEATYPVWTSVGADIIAPAKTKAATVLLPLLRKAASNWKEDVTALSENTARLSQFLVMHWLITHGASFRQATWNCYNPLAANATSSDLEALEEEIPDNPFILELRQLLKGLIVDNNIIF
jgi:hypothetical protein